MKHLGFLQSNIENVLVDVDMIKEEDIKLQPE